MLKYLVLGAGKSGTTALHTAIWSHVDEPRTEFFEPKDLQEVLAWLDPGATVAKVLVEQVRHDQRELLREFDKRVFIVRDPRDGLVSRLLYRVRDMKFIYHPDRVAVYLNALKGKEADPRSRSVVSLYRLLEDVSGHDNLLASAEEVQARVLEMWNAVGDAFHLIRYEQFIDGDCDAVSAYLGMPITADVEVDPRFQRVTRTRGYGDWKHWFTDEDIEYTRRMYGGLMSAFDYDDWDQPQQRVIEAQHASGYVERIIKLKRTRQG